MRRSLAHSLVAGLVTGTCLVTAGPAAARSVDVTDPPGDVMKASSEHVFEDCETEEGCEEQEPEFVRSDTPVGDIVSSRFDHQRRQIRVTTTYRDLARPSAGTTLDWTLFTRGANGQRRILNVSADRARPGGTARMERVSNGRVVCRGHVARRIDYAANTVSVSFPRWCAGKPLRIKLSGLTFRWREQQRQDSTLLEMYYDNPFVDGGKLEGWSDLGWTPWLRRG